MSLNLPRQIEFSQPFLQEGDGMLCPCIDYRNFNNTTLCDSYLLPRMNEHVDPVGDKQLFSTVNANSVYWQIERD